MIDQHGFGCMLTGHICPYPDRCGCVCHKQEAEAHEQLGWDECMLEDCRYHDDEHVETQGRRSA